MSVSLLRDNKDGSKVIWSHAVSAEEFYRRCWDKGVRENNIRLFRECAEFYASDLPEVLDELQRLKEWALKELSKEDSERMVERIEGLQYWIPKECENDGGMFFLA